LSSEHINSLTIDNVGRFKVFQSLEPDAWNVRSLTAASRTVGSLPPVDVSAQLEVDAWWSCRRHEGGRPRTIITEPNRFSPDSPKP